MKSLLYLIFVFVFITPTYAAGETLMYIGTIKVKKTVVPAKATYQELDNFTDPKIQISYEISGEEYKTVYMSNFGDKFSITSNSLTVYNKTYETKQNYYFSGKSVSWIEFLMY
jgi:hypothetical protein